MSELITSPSFLFIEKDKFGDLRTLINCIFSEGGNNVTLKGMYGEEFFVNLEDLSKFVKEAEKHSKEIKKKIKKEHDRKQENRIWEGVSNSTIRIRENIYSKNSR